MVVLTKNYENMKTVVVEPNDICIGGNIFGYSCDEDESIRILSHAHDLKIQSVDTADVYTDGDSERIIGKALKGKRHSWKIYSKIGTKSRTDHVLTPALIEQKLKSSLARLRTDYIDLYQIHNFDHQANIISTVSTLENLKKKGLILEYGVSNFSVAQIDKYSEVDAKIFSNQIYCNFLRQKLAFSFANVQDLKLIFYGVLGRGVLSGKYLNNAFDLNSRSNFSASVRSDLDPNFLECLSKLSFHLNLSNLSLLEFCIASIVSIPNFWKSIIAFRKREQLIDLSKLFEKKIHLPDQDTLIEKLVSYPVKLGEPVAS